MPTGEAPNARGMPRTPVILTRLRRGGGSYHMCIIPNDQRNRGLGWVVQVVGETEKENRTVNVRTRDNARHGEHKLADMIEVLRKERDERSLESCFGHTAAQTAAAPAAATATEAAPKPAPAAGADAAAAAPNGAAENGSAQQHAA